MKREERRQVGGDEMTRIVAVHHPEGIFAQLSVQGRGLVPGETEVVVGQFGDFEAGRRTGNFSSEEVVPRVCWCVCVCVCVCV
ncbi:unnamed protein product [Protopolystoma xenopodis]|uniref:Uncharacterized protein n=1 Tax=Protopolystoma xenopodis TaxID=117903 RepID=A0A448X8W6_9PLAT|nr:unnamed protein product [Protopolystoma xenopodis]